MNSALLGNLGFAPMMTRVRTRTLAGARLSRKCEEFVPVVFSHGLVGTRNCYSTVLRPQRIAARAPPRARLRSAA